MDVDIIDGEVEYTSKTKKILIGMGVLISVFLIVLFNVNLPEKSINARLSNINNSIYLEQEILDKEIVNLYDLLDKKDKLDKTDKLFLENESLLNVKIDFSKSRLEKSYSLITRLFRQKLIYTKK